MPDIRAGVAATYIAGKTRDLTVGIAILAVFERYAYLAARGQGGESVVLVATRSDGAFGPLGVVLDEWPDWDALRGLHGTLDNQILCLGGTRIDFGVARLRSSATLRPETAAAVAVLARLREVLRRTPSRSDFLKAFVFDPAALSARLSVLGIGVRERDEARLAAGAEDLAGLGTGLTPAGDDFLCGVMTAAWAFAGDPAALCRPILAAARPLTTTLSGAFLAAAAHGHVNEAWRCFLSLLSGLVPERVLRRGLDDILAFGGSSGADTLAGFLWAAERLPLGLPDAQDAGAAASSISDR